MLSEKPLRLRGNSTVFTLFAIIVVGMSTLGWYGYNLVQDTIDPEIVYNFKFSEAEVGLFKHTINESGDIEAAENEEVKCEHCGCAKCPCSCQHCDCCGHRDGHQTA